jgi:hypothetical protein
MQTNLLLQLTRKVRLELQHIYVTTTSGEEVEYRQNNARKVGLGFVIGSNLGPNGPKTAINA